MKGKRKIDDDIWSGKWLTINRVEIHEDDDFTMIVKSNGHFKLQEFEKFKMRPEDIRMIAKMARLNAEKEKEEV
tara:strand:+ start:9114 stop:9335 length:222 start_codon:yes stop_codon:yes gene_type:complete